ncbi:hypothetical protein HWV62_1120 [Athelia sp. TMB]|nr:hypothetical protein HWV62_1120 [Athelia sp. TMB]
MDTHNKSLRAPSFESSDIVLTGKKARLGEIDAINDAVAGPSHAIQSIAMGSTFNAIGTSGTVTMVAGHYINHNYIVDSTAGNDIHRNSSSEPATIHSSPSQPLPPEIFYGRDDLVSDLAGLISRTEKPKIAILGPGGMGKTSTALHLINHPTVIARYQERRFFVGCDALTSTEGLAQRILQVIKAAVPAGENLVDTVHRALMGAAPTLLLLDNFESVWEAESDHGAIRDLLLKASNASSASLIITMRAATPPPGVRWTYFESLPPLSPASSRDIFLAINGSCGKDLPDSDAVLEELLKELDYVPLAIHLLAQVSLGFSPRFMLEQWRERRTQILRLDSFTEDKLESVEVSVSLSIKSLERTGHAEAIRLLGMFCLLPDGLLQWQTRLGLVAQCLPTSPSDFLLLRKFALVYTTGNKLGVLSPIRHFILQHYPPDSEYVQCVHGIFWKLVGTYARVNFGPEFNSAKEALRPDIGNISNLIEHAVQYHPTERILDVAIDMSWHFYLTYPSTDILKMVSPLEPTADPAMRARFWEISGLIAYKQYRYTEATSSVTQARVHFLVASNDRKVAHCSYRSGDILRMQCQYPAATAMLTQARDEFLALDDPTGLGRCLQGLGNVLYMQEKYPEASARLTEARDEFLTVGEHLGATQCLRSLGDVLYMQSEYSEASIKLTEARREFLTMGEDLGATQCQHALGQILQGEQKYDEASEAFKDARAEFLKIGDRLGATQCLQSLGEIFVTQKIFSDASATLTEALDQYRDIGDRYGESQCLESLGEIFLAQGQRTEGESLLVRARDLFLEIGMEGDAARCFRKIGNVIRSEAEKSGFGKDGLQSSAEQSETEHEDAAVGGGNDDE